VATPSEDEQVKPQQARSTDSGIEIAPVYRAADLDGWDPQKQLGEPGRPPYTRGIYPDMYRGRLWTMRQYAGFGTAEATNERFRFLLSAGQTGLSCAFDLPTQMGLDSDHPRAEGEVGKVGVAIDSLADMRLLLKDIPLAKVTTSMTINATAAILLLLYQLVAEEQGVAPEAVKGTVQNDILKEYVARGTYVYPPRPSMRLVTDTFAYCAEHLKSWNTISISGYHIREPVPRPCRRSLSRSPTGSHTSRRLLPQASTSTHSRHASASSGTLTTTSSRRSPSTGLRDACGRGS